MNKFEVFRVVSLRQDGNGDYAEDFICGFDNLKEAEEFVDSRTDTNGWVSYEIREARCKGAERPVMDFAKWSGEISQKGKKMAKIEDLTVTIKAGMKVDDETAERCLRLLEWYLDDNPGRRIEGERSNADGKTRFSIVYE